MLLCSAAWAEARPAVGDVNSDGNIDIDDVNAIINVIARKAEYPDSDSAVRYDLNHDNSIDIDDLNKLINIMLHKGTPGMVTVNGVSFRMVTVEGGTFSMGATAEQGSDYSSDERPVHQVTLNSFLLGETEVTQELWQAVMGSNPSCFTDNPQLPVERVSWDDSNEFIARLNALTGRTFRLPSEAEWEYAARGGNKSDGYKYAGGDKITDVAWHGSAMGTHPVGGKKPNELGLYDMSGNVWEWCHDPYGAYGSDAQVNPSCGITASEYRVARGGSWYDAAGSCRVTARGCTMPSHTGYSVGLRLAEDAGGISRLTLETEFLKMDWGNERTVAISGGSGHFTATATNPDVARVTITNTSALTIKACLGGSTVIVVTDTETMLTASIAVTVNNNVPQSMRVAGSFNDYNWDTALDMVQVYDAANVFWHLVYIDQKGIQLMAEGFILDYNAFNIGGDLADEIVNANGKIASKNPGWFLVVVNTSVTGRKNNYDVQFNRPEVYMMGSITPLGAWSELEEGTMFEVPAEASADFVSPPFAADAYGDYDGGVRAYVKIPGFEWWKSEFMIYGPADADGYQPLEYRGMGPDQNDPSRFGERVKGNKGQRMYFNFTKEKGKIEY